MSAKIKLRLHAKIRINNEGKKELSYRRFDYLHEQLNQYPDGKDVVVTVETSGPKRSNQQNNYWWGVVYPLLGEMTGYTDTEVHEWCKSVFLKPRILSVKGKTYYVPRSTTSLTVSEGVEYTDNLRNLAVELGGYIPTPLEAGYIPNK